MVLMHDDHAPQVQPQRARLALPRPVRVAVEDDDSQEMHDLPASSEHGEESREAEVTGALPGPTSCVAVANCRLIVWTHAESPP